MAARKLTKRYFTYNIAKYEKKTGKGVLDLLDVGNMEINKIGEIIKLGNSSGSNECSDETAFEILDNYLRDYEDDGVPDAYFDLIEELDRDLKILKRCGITVSDIKKQFKESIDKRVADGFKFNQEVENEVYEDIENQEDVVTSVE